MTEARVACTTDRRVSVIIPTLNSEMVLPRCIRSIHEQTVRPGEIIVSDGGSSDATQAIAAALGATVVIGPANRSAQRNRGAESASGEYLVFIDSDMQLRSKVIEACLLEFKPADAALVIPEVFVGSGFWADVRSFERSFYDGVWWVEAARWYRASQFHEIGGFDTTLIGPEDWDLDQRIRRFGAVTSPQGRLAYIEHNEGYCTLRHLLRKKAHYAPGIAEFRRRHPQRAELSLSPARRLQLFVRQPSKAARHPALAAGLAVLGAGELMAARGWIGRDSNHPERAMAQTLSGNAIHEDRARVD